MAGGADICSWVFAGPARDCGVALAGVVGYHDPPQQEFFTIKMLVIGKIGITIWCLFLERISGMVAIKMPTMVAVLVSIPHMVEKPILFPALEQIVMIRRANAFSDVGCYLKSRWWRRPQCWS